MIKSHSKARLQLHNNAIDLIFDSEDLAQRANKRLYLSSDFKRPAVGKINFICDNNLDDPFSHEGTANSVTIKWNKSSDGRRQLNLKVFNEFTVCLLFDKKRIDVFYPDHAPLTYLLDDVLQAAIQPFLEQVNGFILHGSCMVLDNTALALMGDSGAGKSTSAFNLVNAGFQCYADDAIVVIPYNSNLYAIPFSREMSLRPLSYNLLKKQGFEFSGYRKEGKKYYFEQPDIRGGWGAQLTHVCLIEVGGESETIFTALTQEQLRQRLLAQNRYFSFINRDRHDYYADIITNKISFAHNVQLGFDLKAQAQAFKILINPSTENSKQVDTASVLMTSRKDKLKLIKGAWTDYGSESLVDLIPMLVDSDLKIFKNAFSFFQNFPLAQIEPFNTLSEMHPSPANIIFEKKAPSWLRIDEWIEGCDGLIAASCPEAYDQYATGWFHSAPILFTFFKQLLEPESADYKAIIAAWDKRNKNLQFQLPKICHILLLLPENASSYTNANTREIVQSELMTNNQQFTLSLLSTPEQLNTFFDNTAVDLLEQQLILIPVFERFNFNMNFLFKYLKLAQIQGFSVKLLQTFSLDWIDENQVKELLASNVFSTPAATIPIASLIELIISKLYLNGYNITWQSSEPNKLLWQYPGFNSGSFFSIENI